MRCLDCQCHDSKVIESRELEESAAIRRRRQCLGCGKRFTTYERIETPNVVVVKKDGRRELFVRDKIAAGIYRAMEKRSISAVEIEKLISRIEREIRATGEPEVESARIGELAMLALEELDEVAYVRFASVYRRFSNVEEFENELKHLRRR